MLNIEDYKDQPLFNAIIELNKRLIEKNTDEITLNVIGGFALMIHDIRNKSEMTDIDYVGNDLAEEVSNISQRIGLEKGLDRHWINNDVMLSGSKIEDFKLSTGDLNFKEVFELEKIRINVLEIEDLLKLKVIAIDTALSAVDYGGDFTRMKDFNDIIKICDKLDVSIADLENKYKDFIINKKTIPAIITYKEQGAKAAEEMVDRLQYEFYKQKYENKEYKRSSFIDNILNQAINRVEKEKSSAEEEWKDEEERQLEEMTGLDIGKTGFRNKNDDPYVKDDIEEKLEDMTGLDVGKTGFKNPANQQKCHDEYDER